MIKCLLQLVQQNHVDINARTSGGSTPLMAAVETGNVEATGLLLNARANPFCSNALG